MSETFDIEEQRVRIRRAIEESEKFSAEQRKLSAEERKLVAEALKLERDRLLSPWLVIVAVVGGVGGLVAGLAAVFNLLRGMH